MYSAGGSISGVARFVGWMGGWSVVSVLPRVAVSLSFLSSSSANGRYAGLPRCASRCRAGRAMKGRPYYHARIRDETIHVEALGQAHRTCGGKALGTCSRHERSGIERNRGSLLALLLLDRRNARARSACNMLHNLIGFALDLESRGCMIRRELQVLVAEIALDDPIVFRHERQTSRSRATMSASVGVCTRPEERTLP